MAIDLAEYERLKKKASEVKTEIDRAEGRLQTLMSSLQEEFGCSTIEAAEEKLEELKEQQKKAETSYNNSLERFKQKYGDLLK